MRILICASSAPVPPLDGFRLLLDQLLRGLRASNDLRVVAPWPADQPAPTPPADLRLVATRHRRRLVVAASSPGGLLGSRPLGDDRLAAALWPAIRHELASFSPDVVYLTSGALAGLARRLEGWPTVLGAIDARHLNVEARGDAADGLQRLAIHEQARRLRHVVATDYPRFGHIVVVTAEDRDALLAIDPHLPVSVIPNGVDATVFRPAPPSLRRNGQIVFTGTMSYPPNVTTASLLVSEVFPRVRVRRPDATLVLAGRDPIAEVRDLAVVPGVTVTGEVPDIRPWLVQSHAFAAPMTTGTGIKNKLLEAMACGLPCVASPLALQGLQIENGRQALVAEGAEATALALTRILEQPDLADRLGYEARDYVRRAHSWETVVDQHVGVFEQVVAASRRRATPTAPPHARVRERA